MVVVYKTKRYSEKIAKDPSRQAIVERKIDDLSNRVKLEHYNKNPKCYDKKGVWVYKFQGIGQNMRLVLEEVKDETGDHQLMIVRDYIAQNEYEPKWRTIIEPVIGKGKFLEQYPLPVEERNLAEAYFRSQVLPQKEQKDDLPEDLKDWLKEFGINNQFDIYESNIWPNYQVGSDDANLSYIFEILKKIHKEGANNQFNRPLSDNYRNIYVHTEFGISLVYDHISLVYGHDRTMSMKPILLLHGWVHENALHGLDKLIDEVKYYKPLNENINAYTLKSITYSAFKGYPSTILTSIDGSKRWKEIQSASNRSNLALSPEQVDFLAEVKFPKFINGQAGSGKSEMLMYMFSELHFRKELDEFSGFPVFLTENSELLERAKNDAQVKLLFNSRYQEYGMNVSDIRSDFHTFKDFLREKFVDEDDEVFEIVSRDDNYINFYKFKNLYENSYLKKSTKRAYPAELCWFVINTFVRGYSIDKEEFTVEDFSSLARRDKSFISDEIFNGVFTFVYLPFYQKLLGSGKYWDRLSLIRFIRKKYTTIPKEKKVTIILCDEAQDFTRLELQFLLKLSIYSDFDVEKIGQVPIAFAGDPFQTVNPTGFNLAQIDRLFSGELLETYNILNEESFIYNLSNNYRSTPEIVNLANAMQLIRYQYLEHSELDRAQKSRRLSSKKTPVLLRIKSVDKTSLLDKTSLMVYISACDNGEENEYLLEDNLLNENIVLKSASLSKGNEYDNVVLYKFGQSFCQEFGGDFLDQLLSGNVKFADLNPGLQFRLTFFFNKLYVAVTRAKEEILILDTDEGCSSFWEKIKNEIGLDEALLSKWGEIDFSTLYIEANNLKLLSDISLEEGFRNAQTEIEQGEIHHDPEKMILAAKWLQKINRAGKYDNLINYCRARAYEYNDELTKAGDLFASCGRIEQLGISDSKELASDCYWKGGYWKKLLQLFSSDMFSGPEQEIRILIAEIMLKKDFDIQKVIRYGYRIQEAIDGGSKYSKLSWESEFYTTFVSLLIQNKGTYVGRSKELADVLNTLSSKNDDLKNLIASLYFSAQEHLKAFDIWTAISNTDHPDFYQAALVVKTDFNDKLIYLDKLERYEEIGEYYIPKQRQIDENSLKILVSVFYSKRGNERKLAQVLLENDKSILHFANILSTEVNIKTGMNFFETVILHLGSDSKENPSGSLYNSCLEIGLSLLNKYLGTAAFNLLTNGFLTNSWRGHSGQPRALNKLLNKDDKGFSFYYSIMNCLAKSNVNLKKNKNPIYENLVRNFVSLLQNTSSKDRTNRVDFVLLTASVDKVIEKYSIRQKIYAELPMLFLRYPGLDRYDRSIIEERFWYCRFMINLIDKTNDIDIRQELLLTYNIRGFKETSFIGRATVIEQCSFDYLKRLKTSPAYSELISNASKTKFLGLIDRGDNKYADNIGLDVNKVVENLHRLSPEKRAEILRLLKNE